MRKRKIAIFTGNRAEYGLLYSVIKAIKEHPKLRYYLLVSGSHLQEDFGYTVKEIKKDGFKVYAEVKLKRPDDSVFSTAQAIGSGILNLSIILKKLKPDMLIVYADRYEGFSAMITGTQMNIPTAHIEGGDLTEGGALDDSVRHAMTKLAHLHFTTNKEAAERIKKLGEEEWRIFNVGAPVLDLIEQGKFASPQEIIQKFKIDLEKPLVLFTQHSVTTEYEKAGQQIKPSLEALEDLAKQDYQIIITYPNNDAGGKEIIKKIKQLKKKKIQNIHIIKSLGRYYYHGLMNICGRIGKGVCVGNSSSGIKETPAFGCPVVNIGSRQNKRLRARNVIDVGYSKKDIIKAVKYAVTNESFREKCKKCNNPYGKGNVGLKIANVIANIELGKKILQKKMTY